MNNISIWIGGSTAIAVACWVTQSGEPLWAMVFMVIATSQK